MPSSLSSTERTRWHCEACGASNVVEMRRGIDVWSGAMLIADDHGRESNDCDADLMRSVRVQIVED